MTQSYKIGNGWCFRSRGSGAARTVPGGHGKPPLATRREICCAPYVSARHIIGDLLCLVTPCLTANLAPEPTLHGSDILSGRTQITVPAAIILRYRLWPDAERFLTMPQSVVRTISIVGGVDDQHVGLGPVGDVGWDRSQQPPDDAAVESGIADDQQVRIDLLGQIH